MTVSCPKCASKVSLLPADLASRDKLKSIHCGACGVDFDASTIVSNTVAKAKPVLETSAAGAAKPQAPSSSITVEPMPAPAEAAPARSQKKPGLETAEVNVAEVKIARASKRLPQKIGGYEIVAEINRGGMGIVYKARDPQLRRQVAIKVLLAGEGASEEDVKRFQREAQATARLQHSNIVPIYAVGTHEGKPYFVMDFIEGKTARQLKEEGKVTPRLALSIIEGVAEALHHAHLNGVIHRDVKPGNIIVDQFERAQLMDFGLARRVDEDLDITQSGTTMGTPSYMAPEQAEGKLTEVDAQSDLYSAGACLYELLTGQPPFDGATIMAVLRKVVDELPQPPRQLNTKIHRDVETICMKCLEKDKANRYASCKQLADDIRRFNAGESISAKPLGLIPSLLKKARRHKEVTIAGILVILAIFSALGYSIHQSRAAERDRIAERRRSIDDAMDNAKRLFKDVKTAMTELSEASRVEFEKATERVHDKIVKAQTAFRQVEIMAPEEREAKDSIELLRKQQIELEVKGFVFRAKAFLNPMPDAADGKVDQPNHAGAEFAAKEALKRDPDNQDARQLLNKALGIRPVVVETTGAPAEVFARRVQDATGRAVPAEGDERGVLLGTTPIKGKDLEPGLYILTFQRKNAGAQQYTLAVARESRDDELQIRVPVETPDENMALIPEGNVNLPQLGIRPVPAFYIDRFEYPNKAGATPMTGVSPLENYKEAKLLCAKSGKTVCTSAQWLRACMGDTERRYPYGKAYVPAVCATGVDSESQRRAFPSGYFPRCKTPEGVYDMSGNVAEWTQTEQTETIYGGEWTSLTGVPDLTVACRARLLTAEGNPDRLGFRCCKAK